MVANCKMSHNIGEELVKPAAITMVKILGGTDIAKKYESAPLSDNTVNRRIEFVSEDVVLKSIVALKIEQFSQQTDKSVVIADDPELMFL